MFKRGGQLPSSTQRVLLVLPIWVATSLWMWLWWLNGRSIGYEPLYMPLTAAILYEYALLPSIFLYFILIAKKPRRRFAPEGKKVALITLCVPSQESIDIIEKQLAAMIAVQYPHDNWILDEGNSMKIKRLAQKYGVKYFSRKGIKKYNQSIPPFKAKTKAGNVNAWLDRVKRRKYDFFVQLDIDHTPKSNYLKKTLGYFRDPKVGWVQAPSIYKNTEHWTARGAAELELVFQGPLQMGFYGLSETPFIIGSHCTYRMSAIREIGGFQPTRAEDHLDTVAMASKEWKGVFLPEIIAEGDGPETLNTYFAQHFAWAYSMFQVLIYHSPKLISTMSLRKRLQFLFAQTWYPLWSLSYMIMFFTPIAALSLNHSVLATKGPYFILHFLPMFGATFLIWWAARPLMQPKSLKLSWRGVLLHAARWPIILRAIFSAAFKVKKPYMITPKGRFANQKPTLRLYSSFLLLGFISCLSIGYASLAYGYRATANQMFFAFMNILFALLICTVDLDLRMRQAKGKLVNLGLYWLKPVAAVMALLVFSAILVSTTVVKEGVTYAIAFSNPPAETVDLSSVSPSRLTNQELMKQLSDTPYYQTGKQPPQIGIFDPKRRIRTEQGYIRHSFVDWRENRQLAEQLLITERLGAVPLITLEPRGQDNGQVLLTDITTGKYDQQMTETFKVISMVKGPVYVRFAHEMDLSDLYPWGAQDPESFIAAYRHTVELARSERADNIKWIWSPVGNANATAYYPGDDVVDAIGTTVLYDRYWYYDYHPTFEELTYKRHWLTSYSKPVWIVEFGAGDTDPDYQRTLIQDALYNFRDYGYSALVYLNIVDSNIQGPDYRVADLGYFGDSLKPIPFSAPSLVNTLKTKTVSNQQKYVAKSAEHLKPDNDPNIRSQKPTLLMSLDINQFSVKNESSLVQHQSHNNIHENKGKPKEQTNSIASTKQNELSIKQLSLSLEQSSRYYKPKASIPIRLQKSHQRNRIRHSQHFDIQKNSDYLDHIIKTLK